VIQDLDERAKIISLAFQKRQTGLAVRAGILLLPELGIYLHPLDKLNSGFHDHPLTGIFGMEVPELKS